MKVADLRESVVKEPAKEMLIVRVLRIRQTMAGKTPKWECDLIDDDSACSVLLMDAWGGNISRAKNELEEGNVYKITNYTITSVGKAIPFGNNTIKSTINPKVGIEHLQGDHPDIPLHLPLADLAGVFDLRAPRVLSLVLAIDTPAIKKSVEIKRTGATKDVANVMMKAKNLKIEFSAWGQHATEMSSLTGDVRLDAVQVIPSVNGDSVKLSTLDCTTIRKPTQEESDTLHEELASDERMQTVTRTSFVGKRQTEMAQKTSVTNIEVLSMCVLSEFDPHTQTKGDQGFSQTYEIPSAMIMSIAGIDYTDVQTLSYRACPKCNFKKLGEDAKCSKCGGCEYVERHLLRCTISDPTGSIDGIMHHDAAEEFLRDEDLLLKPVVALVHVAPDSHNPGKHSLEFFAIKQMFTATGVLNIFRAPLARFHCSGDKVIPTYPSEVQTNAMSQTIVYGAFCSNVRFLLTITTPKPITEVEAQVDGMRCEQTATCCVTSTPISLKLAGSFDTVAPLYSLTKKATIHVLCTPSGQTNSDGLDVYKPLKVYAIQDEDKATIFKAFKFEVKEVQTHFDKNVEEVSPGEETPKIKLKASENQTFSSPGWSSPPRRLKISKTDEAASAGIQRDPP